MPADPCASLVRAAALAHFDELVRSLGGDPAALLRACRLAPHDLTDLDRYLPYRCVALAIEGAPKALAAPDFGLRLCALQSVDTLGLLSLAIQSAPTVREGMLQVDKYVHFHNPALTFRNFMAPGEGLECLEVIHRRQPLAEMPQITEICVSYLCRLIDLLSEGALRPAAIHLRHAPLGSSAQYRHHMAQLPRFRSTFDGIAMDPLAWRRPLPRHNRLLQQFVERFLPGIGQPPGRDAPMADQVRAVVGSLMRVGKADLAAVARVLKQHPRTLQRRLCAEGVLFEGLRDAARADWARQLLAQSGLSLGDISNLLGFADQSVLTRACQRWFGAAPRQLRRSLLGSQTQGRPMDA
ncbi:MAG: AraC family transcriptional regulator ligand-binding domain-containing protein [Pseudomonadota bacterium]|nr:AraC family transcriptional regulator ligand-binding domain-containing protein [Pseudomonadota bacterium]